MITPYFDRLDYVAAVNSDLVYVQAVADLPDLSPEDTDRLPLLCDWMTEVGCGGAGARTWRTSS